MPIGAHTAKLKKQHPIEAELARLQDAHRLAIHVWEVDSAFKFPKYSWSLFNAYPDEEMLGRIADKTMPTISMSLIPSTRSGFSMRPYNIHMGRVKKCGYLVDFEQSPEHPTRVLRVATRGLISCWDALNKKFRLDGYDFTPLIEDYYKGKTEASQRKDAADEQGGKKMTEAQLDLLGGIYDSLASAKKTGGRLDEDRLDDHGIPVADDDPFTIDFNEILATSSRSHIKAIAVPIYQDPAIPSDIYLAAQKLTGAIAGLQHLKRKAIDLNVPVVLYHVNDNAPCRCTYLAQGEAECIKVAREAIAQLESKGVLGNPLDSTDVGNKKYGIDLSELSIAVKRELNKLDIEQPIAAQHKANAKLDQRIKEATIRER